MVRAGLFGAALSGLPRTCHPFLAAFECRLDTVENLNQVASAEQGPHNRQSRHGWNPQSRRPFEVAGAIPKLGGLRSNPFGREGLDVELPRRSRQTAALLLRFPGRPRPVTGKPPRRDYLPHRSPTYERLSPIGRRGRSTSISYQAWVAPDAGPSPHFPDSPAFPRRSPSLSRHLAFQVHQRLPGVDRWRDKLTR